MKRKIYILDTNVYLTNHRSLFDYSNGDVIIPLKVLDEIDKHKKRQDLVGYEARSTIRLLDELREKGNLTKGIRIAKGKGKLFVKSYNPFNLPDDLDLEDSDNQIIATALTVIEDNPGKKVILVSLDINMRVKCDSLNIITENYHIDKVLDNANSLYSGIKEIVVDDKVIDQIYQEQNINSILLDYDIYPNQFIFAKSNMNDKRTALVKNNRNGNLVKCEKLNAWGLKPRNKEQILSLDLLFDKEIPVVSLIGRAGSGKTLLALAAGLEQTINKKIYDRIIVTKPVHSVGKDIGYLPGTMEEKMALWIAPIKDNLKFMSAVKSIFNR